MLRLLTAGLACFTLSTPAASQVVAQFVEGAPKDRFVFEVTGGCPLGPARLEIDLTGSNGGLIFDVTASGAGVEVYQPFELVSGAERVIATSEVEDGSQRLSLDVDGIDPGTRIAFTIDVDDTIGAREITVSGAEITGAQARLVISGVGYTGIFDALGRAEIPFAACLS